MSPFFTMPPAFTSSDPWKFIHGKMLAEFDEDTMRGWLFPEDLVSQRKEVSEKHQYVYATEDLTTNDIAKLRTLPGLDLPCSATLDRWRDELTEGVWELQPNETQDGFETDCSKWLGLLAESYLPHMASPDAPVSEFSIVATLDYAKKPALTLCGLQLCHPAINQSSSLNYHIVNCYLGEESKSLIEKNCSNLVKFLQAESQVGAIRVRKELLCDFSLYETIIGESCM